MMRGGCSIRLAGTPCLRDTEYCVSTRFIKGCLERDVRHF